MRTTAAGAQVALEQENIKLRAQLAKANEEIASLKEARLRPRKEESRREEWTAMPPKAQRQPKEQLCPGSPKQIGPGVSTRAKDRSVAEEESESIKIRREIQSLAEQVAALKEIVVQTLKEEMQKKDAARQGVPTNSAGETQAKRNKEADKTGRTAKPGERGPTAKLRAEQVTPPEDADNANANSNAWSKVIGRKAKKEVPKERKQEAQRKAPLCVVRATTKSKEEGNNEARPQGRQAAS